MFTKIVALGIIALQIGTLAFIVLWITKSPLLLRITRHSHILLSTIFIGSAFASLIYEFVFGFEPCLLCWYQRIAIFGVAILSVTGDIRKSRLLQKQVFIFSLLGLLVAIIHNYIDIVPTGIDICGAGPSCLKRYIYEFGYITIPMASFTALLAGFVLALFNFKHKEVVTVLK